jgi:ABC-type transporter Mla subunit MlaD
LALIGAGFGSRKSRKNRLVGFLLLGVVLIGLVAMPACGSNSHNGGGGNGGTPAGAYTITITGSDSNGVTQTGSPATVAVTVN